MKTVCSAVFRVIALQLLGCLKGALTLPAISDKDIDIDDPIFNQELNMNGEQQILHRHKRELDWDSVETFYEDKNNFAMYLVLPIIVIVYGGCAVIYCIARCRRYVKRKKKKPNEHKDDLGENEPLEINSHGQSNGNGQRAAAPAIPVISTNPNPLQKSREGAHSSSEVRIAMENEPDHEPSLPWQVPGDKKSIYPAAVGATGGAGAMAAQNDPERDQRVFSNKAFDEERGKKGFSNKAYEHETNEKRPPPSYEETYHKEPPRPQSKPPPYEENNRHRRGSVEEIITLDPQPMPNAVSHNPDYNDRKRRRPGSRPSSRVDHNSLDAEEREKARQLVRGDRPRRETPTERIDRERTPDIISHARTRPLEPRYKPTSTAQTDASLMAKQAAQLLRLDHIGKQQGKKQKRLVFVAE